MANDKTEKKSATETVAENLLAGQFNTTEELAAAYEKLKSEVGRNGNELGTAKQEAEQYKNLAQQYAQAYQQAAQYQNYLAQHGQEFVQWLNNKNQQQSQAAQQGVNGVLSPEEQQALIQAASNHMLQQYIQPLDQLWQKRAAEYQQAVLDRASALNKATSDIIWRGVESLSPKEKVEEIRKIYQMALDSSDPSKQVDPITQAQSVFARERDLAELKAKNEELQKSIDEREKRAFPTTGNATTSLFGQPKPADDGASSDATAADIIKDVMQRSGDAFHQEFAGSPD